MNKSKITMAVFSVLSTLSLVLYLTSVGLGEWFPPGSGSVP